MKSSQGRLAKKNRSKRRASKQSKSCAALGGTVWIVRTFWDRRRLTTTAAHGDFSLTEIVAAALSGSVTFVKECALDCRPRRR
jgi:hypothetical protein